MIQLFSFEIPNTAEYLGSDNDASLKDVIELAQSNGCVVAYTCIHTNEQTKRKYYAIPEHAELCA